MSIRIIGVGLASLIAGILLFNIANSDWQKAVALIMIIVGIAAMIIGVAIIGGGGSKRD